MSAASAPARAGNHRGPFHVVIITPYFWPILASSTHLMKDLAEGLAGEGCRVTVLSNGPNTATREADGPLLAGSVHRAWNPFLRRLGVLSKFCEYLWFMAYFLLRGLAIPGIDVIFVASTPPLAGLPAALLARLKGAKMVYNLQDIFPDSAVVAGMLPAGGWIYRCLRKAEEATYRSSDLVSSISPAFSEYVQRLVPGTPVATIPNWVDTDHIRPRESAEDPDIAAFRRGGAFVVQYAGNIGFMQNLETLVEAAEQLKGVPGIRFIFIGDGNAKQTLQELARQRGLANCEFLPLQPLDRVPSVYNACDLGVIPLKPGAAHIAVPSKTWNYLAAARPVIGCVEEDSPLAQVIRESGSGSVVPPDDPGRLVQVILEYQNAPGRARAEGLQGRTYVEANLSRRTAIKRYFQMFNHVLGRPAETP
ncbi:MAG: glycosyltransferase family 4 protein [Geothrix sp.]|uniref:glycosyltransferase family 4 protein n=1 Tax=Geothrix sp. TaxID=1962974 RepID=UPI00185DB036|nr:glycosyltransferase family 4 protein [Geothrix sp.]NWJ42566.1 glycosyltransferase family 4 protein [Geothrix sp.]WIL19474.1 MAG: glycosyltransferase family 4 protein [Geothrix sp.]